MAPRALRMPQAAQLAIERLSGRDDLAYHLAIFRARTPRPGSSLAFATCDTIRNGIERLALLKPPSDSSAFFTQMLSDRFRIELRPAEPDIVLLHWAVLCDILFIVELCRNCSGRHIVPSAVGVMDAWRMRREDIDFLGVTPVESECAFLELTLPDVGLPLLTASDDPVVTGTRKAIKQLAPASQTLSRAVAELLPSGRCRIEDAAHHMGINPRKLQRMLKAEGHNFREVVDETRRELALAHLKGKLRSVAEVSYLLGYKDQNSFYRAFKGWTGMTMTEWLDTEE